MIRKASECKVAYKEHMRDGEGTVITTSFIGSDTDLNGKGRLFSRLTIQPGCSIGFHIHEGESELFYIMQGTAQYTDGDHVETVTPGDVCICPAGTGHGIANHGEETVEVIALILYE